MPRGDSGGRATAVVNSHYPKKLISILRLDCVPGARTCLPRGTLSAIKAAEPWIKPVNAHYRRGSFRSSFVPFDTGRGAADCGEYR